MNEICSTYETVVGDEEHKRELLQQNSIDSFKKQIKNSLCASAIEVDTGSKQWWQNLSHVGKSQNNPYSLSDSWKVKVAKLQSISKEGKEKNRKKLQRNSGAEKEKISLIPFLEQNKAIQEKIISVVKEPESDKANDDCIIWLIPSLNTFAHLSLTDTNPFLLIGKRSI